MGQNVRVPLIVVLSSMWSMKLRCSMGVVVLSVVLVHCMVLLWIMDAQCEGGDEVP